MNKLFIFLLINFFAVAVIAPASAQPPVVKINPSDPTQNDQFGYAIDISSSVAIIGAINKDEVGSNSGGAYIYRSAGSGWSEDQVLVASDGQKNANFGAAVAISNDLAIVGAPRDKVPNLNQGSAYIFRFNGTSWVQDQKITASNGGSGDRFGTSVSISGNTAVVGAPLEDGSGIGGNSGAAYIYMFDGTNWNETQVLHPPGLTGGDQVGISVAVNGTEMILGAFKDNTNGGSSGAAYVYHFDGTSWVFVNQIIPADNRGGDHFGISVDIDGSHAVIGSHKNRQAGRNAGAAYTYTFDGSIWVENQKLIGSTTIGNDQFGHSVSLSGNQLMIGADMAQRQTGAAYTFVYDGSTWNEEYVFNPFDGALKDHFGFAVAIFSNGIIIGSDRDDDNGTNSGSAYVYCFDPVIDMGADISACYGDSVYLVPGIANDSVNWYTIDSQLIVADQDTFCIVADAGDTLLAEVWRNGCSGWDTIIVSSFRPLQSSFTTLECSGANSAMAYKLVEGGVGPYTYSWSEGTVNASGDTATNLSEGMVYVTVSDQNGCELSESFDITVDDDVVAPTALCQDITIALDVDGNAEVTAADVDGGTYDNCHLASLVTDAGEFNCAHLGSNTVNLTATDEEGNTGSCAANVTIEDVTAPVALCQDFTIELNFDGTGTLLAESIDNGSSDACGIASLSVSPSSLTRDDVGDITATLTATDGSGNSGTCESTVTVIDPAPIPVCQDATLTLDASGQTAVAAADVDGGSINVASMYVTPSSLGCADMTVAQVVLTVIGPSGKDSSCTSNVTLIDNTAPIALCQDLTVQLDANGAGSTDAASIDNGSSDACGIASMTLSVSAFDCSNVGENSTVLTVTDVNGNNATCNATVTVEDNVAPSALCQNITVQLDASGNGMATAVDVDNGSNDACGLALMLLSPTSFTCANVGDNSAALIVIDNNGNEAVCNATITVQDNVAPTAACNDLTVELDASGAGAITTAEADAGSSDACGVASLSLSQTSFACADLGDVSSILTVTDVNGNSATCTSIVTVADYIKPSVTCPASISVIAESDDCDPVVTWNAPAADDNCSVASVSSSSNSGDEFGVGTTQVDVTVTDQSGNQAVCSFEVTVTPTDLELAELVISSHNCGYNVSCNGAADGSATVQVSGGCEPYSYAWTNNGTAATATGLTAGTHTVVVTDANGTTASATATLTEPDAIVIAGTLSDYSGGTNVSCYGAADGSIATSVSGGCAPYYYDWGTLGATSAQQGLSAGTYTVDVTDANGCVGTATFTVTEPSEIVPVLTATIIEDTASCFTAVEITSATTGGSGVYTYFWEDSSSADSLYIENIWDTTDYTVVVTDENGCTGTATITVEVEDITVNCNGGGPKVEFCHFPQGKPENYHTICISVNAAPAHLRNHEGDHCGPCTDADALVAAEMIASGANSTDHNHDAKRAGFDQSTEFNVYPNPFDGSLNVAFVSDVNQKVNVALVDMTGKLVINIANGVQLSTGEAYQAGVDVTQVPSGVYILRVVGANEIHDRKMVKLK